MKPYRVWWLKVTIEAISHMVTWWWSKPYHQYHSVHVRRINNSSRYWIHNVIDRYFISNCVNYIGIIKTKALLIYFNLTCCRALVAYVVCLQAPGGESFNIDPWGLINEVQLMCLNPPPPKVTFFVYKAYIRENMVLT